MSELAVTLPARSVLLRLPFYYGWVMLVVASLTMTATLPGRTHGLGLITKPVMTELHISEVSWSTLNFWTVILGAAVCWPVGKISDRYGTGTVLTLVVAGLGLSAILTGGVQSWWGLFVLLVLTRGLGQGALSVLSTTLVGKWFSRRVVWAMGIYAILLAFGFIGSIVWLSAAIGTEQATQVAMTSGTVHVGVITEQTASAVVLRDAKNQQLTLPVSEIASQSTLSASAAPKGLLRSGNTWREGWSGMGWILLAGLAPLCALTVRSTPESCGMTDQSATAEDEVEDPREDLSFRDALSSPTFWIFSAASCLFGLAWSAITLFNESVLADRGFTPDRLKMVMGILVGVGLLANISGSWLSSRWPLGRVLGLGMLLLAVAMLAYPFINNDGQLISYAVAFGIASGLVTVVHFAFHPQAFGRTHLGKIQGFFQILSIFTSASGPVLLAQCNAWTGSYTPLFLTVGPVSLILALAAVWVPMPVRRLKAEVV